jgi:hypothetical protein
MEVLNRHREAWPNKSDEWLFQRLDNELKQKVEEIYRLLNQQALIRDALADYIRSEGCSCCQDTEKHQEAAKRLAELINVEPYEDGSGYNFYKYGTKSK